MSTCATGFCGVLARWYRCALVVAVIAASTDCARGDSSASTRPQRGQEIELGDDATVVRFAPSVGRLMHVSRRGESNLLWNNDQPTSDTPGHWINYGGDKVWPWPQRPLWGWPPPVAIDVGPFAPVERAAEEWAGRPVGLRLAGPVDSGTGLSAVRDTWIERGVVHNIYTLERQTAAVVQAGEPLPRIAAWSITQVPVKANVFVRLRSAATAAQAAAMVTAMGGEAPVARPMNGLWLAVSPGPDSGKIGIVADAIAARVGDRVLLLERVAGNDDPDLEQASAAQIYYYLGLGSHYIELELIGPGKQLKPGERASLETQWRILGATEFEELLKH